jgi:hypothetical protein
MNETVLLSTAYLPPINYFARFFLYKNVLIEKHEHFVKQTCRNRCSIYGANGKLDLIIPLESGAERTGVTQKRIAYRDNWRNLHWRSLESAYRSSPYFEFFEQELSPFYKGEKFEFLFDFNTALMTRITELLRLQVNISYTESYQKEYAGIADGRILTQPKFSDKHFNAVPYYQVFENKHGFIPNLSIADLLFNEGLRAKAILQQSVSRS